MLLTMKEENRIGVIQGVMGGQIGVEEAYMRELIRGALMVAGAGVLGGAGALIWKKRIDKRMALETARRTSEENLALLGRKLTDILKMEKEARNGADTDVDDKKFNRLQQMLRGLDEIPSVRPALLQRIEDITVPLEERLWEVTRLVYSYGNRLEYAEARLLQMTGRQMVAEGLPLAGDRLQMRIEEIIRQREAIEAFGKYVTVGGKIRGLSWSGLYEEGFLKGFQMLLPGETPPTLLWPATNPEVLVGTIITILEKIGTLNSEPQRVRISFSVAGSMGGVSEDMKELGLAVHALSDAPYLLPHDIGKNPAKIEWFAPVVDGATGGGAMGHVAVGPDPKDSDGGKGVRRYDHLFLKFEYPPLYLRDRHGVAIQDKVWLEAFAKFEETSGLVLDEIDLGERKITFAFLEPGGSLQEGVWHPSQREWAWLLTGNKEEPLDPGRVKEGFFLFMARMRMVDHLRTVARSVWALGVLREAAGRQNKTEKELVLSRLWERFRSQMFLLLQIQGLSHILETRWVGHTHWSRIYSEFETYQLALQAEPDFKATIQALVADTVQRVEELLRV